VYETIFTKKQGQYLAFIHLYTKINGRPPAEAEMQRYFEVSPPSVHSMIVELEKKMLISREVGRARTVKIIIKPEMLPMLE
jgi:repressor LexA